MPALTMVALLFKERGCQPTVESIRDGLDAWADNAGKCKQRLFDDRMLALAIERLAPRTSADTASPFGHK